MYDLTIAAMFGALVRRFGGVEASAALIEARLGASSKGTISKEISGQAMVSIEHVRALEDALGSYPITKMMSRRMREDAPSDIVSAAQGVAKEAGEAVAALMGAVLGTSPAQRAAAIVEIDEAIEALRIARAALSSEAGGNT